MSCNHYEEVDFVSYLEEKMLVAKRDEFEEHVLGCDDCAATLYRSHKKLEEKMDHLLLERTRELIKSII